MVRLRSKNIVDNSVLKFQYWGNSFLFIQNGYPEGVIISTDTEIEWLATPSEEEKTIVELAMSNESNDWSTITVPNPTYYLIHELYFVGHLVNDNIPLDIRNVLSLTPQVSKELADSSSWLGNAKAPTPVGDLEMVVVNPNQKANTPMEIKNTTKTLQGAETAPKTFSVSVIAATDDHDRGM